MKDFKEIGNQRIAETKFHVGALSLNGSTKGIFKSEERLGMFEPYHTTLVVSNNAH